MQFLVDEVDRSGGYKSFAQKCALAATRDRRAIEFHGVSRGAASRFTGGSLFAIRSSAEVYTKQLALFNQSAGVQSQECAIIFLVCPCAQLLSVQSMGPVFPQVQELGHLTGPRDATNPVIEETGSSDT